MSAELQFSALANKCLVTKRVWKEGLNVFMTCLKGFGQFGAKGLGQEGGGDGAGQADQHHDHVRDLNRGDTLLPGRSAS